MRGETGLPQRCTHLLVVIALVQAHALGPTSFMSWWLAPSMVSQDKRPGAAHIHSNPATKRPVVFRYDAGSYVLLVQS